MTQPQKEFLVQLAGLALLGYSLGELAELTSPIVGCLFLPFVGVMFVWVFVRYWQRARE